jgi:hypothetical protein
LRETCKVVVVGLSRLPLKSIIFFTLHTYPLTFKSPVGFDHFCVVKRATCLSDQLVDSYSSPSSRHGECSTGQPLSGHDLSKMTYDGTTPFQAFLTPFETTVWKLHRLDYQLDRDAVRGYLEMSLRDANPAPKEGLDGKPYVGPET